MDYKQLQIYFFLSILVGSFLLAFLIFLPFLGPLLLGATFAIIFEPLHRKILGALNGGESLAALITTALVLIVVLTPLVFFGVQIVGEARELYLSVLGGSAGSNLLDTIGTLIEGWTENFLPQGIALSSEEISRDINYYAGQALSWTLENIGTIFSSIIRVAFSLFLSLFALYYLLKDGKKLKKSVIALSPLSDHYDKEIFEKLFAVINSVVKGTLVVAILQGILAGIGFAIFGIPQPALWGSLAALTALIPVVGTAAVTFPAVIYLFVLGKISMAVGLLIWVLLLVGSIDNFLRPKLIERGVRLHPFLILLSVLGGVRFFGPIGFLLGPLILSLFFALLDIYQREFRTYISSRI